jgi:hypothetical protein
MASSVDSNYATDKESQGSASGDLHNMGGMITNWLCNTQLKNVTLSTMEAEHQLMSKGLQETSFSQMLIKEIGGSFYAAIILEDKMGTKFLVKNQQEVGARTKHIDVRHHFINEHCEKTDFDVKHVKSEENESDILTGQNSSAHLFVAISFRHNAHLSRGIQQECGTNSWRSLSKS